MTAKKTRQAIQYLTQTTTVTVPAGTSSSQAYTLVNVSDLSSDIVKVIITGKATGGTSTNATTLSINGTFGRKVERDDTGVATVSSSAPTSWRNTQSSSGWFRIEADLASNTVFYSYFFNDGSNKVIDGMALGTIESIGGTLRGHSGTESTLTATIQYIID